MFATQEGQAGGKDRPRVKVQHVVCAHVIHDLIKIIVLVRNNLCASRTHVTSIAVCVKLCSKYYFFVHLLLC